MRYGCSARCALVLFLHAVWMSTAGASAPMSADLRWMPSERWLRSDAIELRLAEVQPWAELAVRSRCLEAGAPLPGPFRLDLGVIAWNAASVRGTSLDLDLGLVRGPVVVRFGMNLTQQRVGAGAARSSVQPRLVWVVRGRGADLLVRWMPDDAGDPADAWAAGVRTGLAGARLALEREPDRYGTGPVWHRSLAVSVAAAFEIGLGWSADDVRVLAELRAKRWRLRVATVVDGPRAGARAIEVGWSR